MGGSFYTEEGTVNFVAEKLRIFRGVSAHVRRYGVWNGPGVE